MKLKRWTQRLALLLVAALLMSCLPMAALAADDAKQYVLDEDGTIDNVPYIIYSKNGNRIIHNDTNKNTTNQCTPSMSGDKSMNGTHLSDKWQPTDDLWNLVKQADGSYFIQSPTNGKYITATASGSQLALGDEGVPFTIDHQGEGVYHVKNGGKYLSFSGGWKLLDAAFEIRLFGEKGAEEPDPVEPTDPPAPPTAPTDKPTVDAEHDLYQVEIMCEVDHAHYWTYPSTVGWAHSSPDQFTVGEPRENDLNNGTTEQYPYICPVTPAYTLDECVAKVNAKAEGHRAVTTEATIPVAYYYWNATDGWTFLKTEEANPNVRFSSGPNHEGTLEIKITCAEQPDQPDPPTPPETDKPTAKPAVGNAALYQVDILCQKHLDGDPDCTNHWWSQAETAAAFTVGDIQANDTGYQEDTYKWVCPVTPAHDLAYYLAQLNGKCEGHKLVSTALPTAWFYWNGESWTLPKEANSEVRFGNNDVGSLSLYATCGEGGDQPDPPTPPDPELPDAPSAPANQPTGEYKTPDDKLSGTGSSEPMSDADVKSYFRIPALVTLPNGWIVAASDARWTNTNDSPNNLDTIVSVSKDGGETWDWEIINYFADFAPIQGPTYYPGASKVASASFIDPALTVDGSGKLWMAVDLQPPNVNLNANAQKAGSGFDENGYLMVGNIPESAYAGIVNTGATGLTPSAAKTLADAHYPYRVDFATSTKTVEKNGKTVKLFPIFHKDDAAKASVGYYVDAFFDLWYDYGENGGIKSVLCLQKDRTDTWVQANLFYIQSDWKAWSTSYLLIRSAEVVDDKLVWGDPMLINHGIKEDNERFLVFCPGRGTIVPLENGGERIMFQLYDNVTGNELASAVYSDDGGKTWERGARTEQLGETGKASESQIVILPDGTLRMYSRNSKNFISYADSTDNGATWGASRFDTNLPYCGNDMVSFINVDGCLVGPDNKVYEHLILASYARGIIGATGQNRNNGVIRIGYINDDAGQTVTWLNDDAVRFSGRYNYSCLTQLPDHAGFAVLYEQDDTVTFAPKGVMAMHFVKLTAADLLGEGWLLTAGKPTEAVTLKVDTALIDLDFGGSRTVAIEVAPADATVVWTSADEAVATVANGVITAVGAGKTTVTVSVTKGTLTRTATIPVMVQPESGALTLPEQYVDSVTTVVTPGTTQYVLDEDGELTGALYIIYSQNGNRVMHNNTQKGATDHCTPSMSGDKAISANHAADRWSPTDDLWKLVKQEDGSYFIQSPTNDKYLTAAASGSQLAIGDAGVPFTIAHQSEGVYHVKNGDKYLAFSGGWRMQDAAFEIRLYGELTTQDVTTYTVSAEGLKALIRAAGMDKADYADALAVEGEYEDEAAAQAALAQINAAAQEVYAQLREGNITRYLVTYSVQGELLAVQSYYPGEIIVPMTDPVREGVIFTGWTGMPADKVMPEHDLALEAAFRPISSGGSSGGGSSRPVTRPADEDLREPDVPLTDLPASSFVDVAQDAWYAKAVAAVAAQGLVKGVGENKFDPAAPMTRGSLAEVLYRMAGSEEQTPAAFTDVAQNAWYANAVAWAAKNGVVTGISDDTFAPDRTITRQELAVMLCRYAKLAGLDTASDAKALEKFSDGGATGDWAVDGTAWCVAHGILEGKGGDVLDPTAQVSRAEVAVMLERFLALAK